jgi:hypothetical protein
VGVGKRNSWGRQRTQRCCIMVPFTAIHGDLSQNTVFSTTFEISESHCGPVKCKNRFGKVGQFRGGKSF